MKIDKHIKIDKKVPIPLKRKYPWAELEVGDSFYVENSKMYGGLHALAAKHHHIKITVRTEGNGFRVWRIA